MSLPTDPTRLSRLAREFALLAAAGVALIGLGRSFSAGQPPAYHLLSGTLVLLGVGLLARIMSGRHSAVVLADTLAALTIAGAVVVTVLTPMRAWSAGAVIALTLGLQLSGRIRSQGVAEALVIAPALLAAVFIGLAVSQEQLGFEGIPWPVAAALVLAMVAGVLGRTATGLAVLLVARTEGGRRARRTIGLVLALVIGLDLARLLVSHLGLLSPVTADRLYAFAVIAALVAELIHVSWRIDASDRGRTASERELRRSEAQARAITDAAQDAIVAIGADGLIVRVNPAAERLYGWDADELVGRSWSLLLAAGERDDERELFAQAMELMADSGTSADADFRHRDGHVVCVEFTVSRIEGGFLTISRDVSGQRQFAATMREQSRQMTALAQAQSRIATGSGSLAQTMAIIAAAASELVTAGGAVIGLRDGDELVCRAGSGGMDGWVDVRIAVVGHDACGVVTEERPVVVGDIDTAGTPAILRGLCRDAGLRTLLALPLAEAGKGATLLIGHAEVNAFDDGALRTLELFAAMAASVLHRAQVEHRLAVTNAVSGAAHADASLEDGLARTLAVLTEQLGWEAAGVWLADPGSHTELHCAAHRIVTPVAAAPLAEVFERPVAVAGSAPLAATFRDATPAWLDLDSAALDGPCVAGARAAGLGVAVHVPLLAAGEALGVLELFQRRSRSRDAEEVDLLMAVGRHVASFVRRRQVELQVSEQAEYLAAVVALSQMLAGIPASQVRFALCEGVCEVARCDVVGIYEPDADGALRLSARSGAVVADDEETIDLTAPALVRQVFATGGGVRVGDVGPDRDHDEFIQRTGMRTGRFEPVLRDGTVIAVLVMLSREQRERSGIGDLTGLLAAEASTALALADLVRALDAQARTDQLTGLANRRTWDEELPMELARAKRNRRPVAVAMLDLDHFKRYNDSFGHPAGDRLLRAVAAGWATRLRETDLLARYGGEEFGVVLPGCDLEAARRVLDELRLCMPDGTTCSIGVAAWDGREDADALVGRADSALYEAKRCGRNRIESALSAH